jgi:hypothetical protein
MPADNFTALPDKTQGTAELGQPSCPHHTSLQLGHEPMLAYHFINAEYGLEALNRHRLKIARIVELNDPFEFLGADLSDPEFRKALEETKVEISDTTGIVCFCRTWKHPILWAHYADRHKGICLGFEVSNAYLGKVNYIDCRFPKPNVHDKEFMKKLLFTKFRHWEYEQEYRLYIELDKNEQVNGLYYINFSAELSLRCVIVGYQSEITGTQISQALGNQGENIEIFKATPEFNTFQLARNHLETS